MPAGYLGGMVPDMFYWSQRSFWFVQTGFLLFASKQGKENGRRWWLPHDSTPCVLRASRCLMENACVCQQRQQFLLGQGDCHGSVARCGFLLSAVDPDALGSVAMRGL